MYTVTVSTEFVAQHFLTVPDPGPEGDLHSHRYTLELTVAGGELDEFGYLVDIDELDAMVATFADRYRDVTLNDQPAFAGLNPSIEHFARIAADHFDEQIVRQSIEEVTVTIAEDDIAHTTYHVER